MSDPSPPLRKRAAAVGRFLAQSLVLGALVSLLLVALAPADNVSLSLLHRSLLQNQQGDHAIIDNHNNYPLRRRRRLQSVVLFCIGGTCNYAGSASAPEFEPTNGGLGPGAPETCFVTRAPSDAPSSAPTGLAPTLLPTQAPTESMIPTSQPSVSQEPTTDGSGFFCVLSTCCAKLFEANPGVLSFSIAYEVPERECPGGGIVPASKGGLECNQVFLPPFPPSTETPANMPSSQPSALPSALPSATPSSLPSTNPSMAPTGSDDSGSGSDDQGGSAGQHWWSNIFDNWGQR